MNLKIEKNVPIPGTRAKHRTWRDLASEMKVGDSVLVTGKDEHEAMSKKQALANAMRTLGQKTMQRQITRGDRTKYRVWRTA